MAAIPPCTAAPTAQHERSRPRFVKAPSHNPHTPPENCRVAACAKSGGWGGGSSAATSCATHTRRGSLPDVAQLAGRARLEGASAHRRCGRCRTRVLLRHRWQPGRAGALAQPALVGGSVRGTRGRGVAHLDLRELGWVSLHHAIVRRPARRCVWAHAKQSSELLCTEKNERKEIQDAARLC